MQHEEHFSHTDLDGLALMALIGLARSYTAHDSHVDSTATRCRFNTLATCYVVHSPRTLLALRSHPDTNTMPCHLLQTRLYSLFFAALH